MDTYFWFAIVGWLVAGLVALAMDMYEHPALRENIGWAEAWPVLLGPFWLFAKLGAWFVWGGSV